MNQRTSKKKFEDYLNPDLLNMRMNRMNKKNDFSELEIEFQFSINHGYLWVGSYATLNQ